MKLLTIASLICLSSSIAFGQITNTINSKNLREAADVILPDRMTYFSVFTGPSLAGDGDPVDESGEVNENSINTWNQVSFQWQLNDTKRFVINPRFTINHNPDDETDSAELNDPVVGIAGQWFKYGNLSFGGGLNTIVPFARTEGTREDGKTWNPGGFQSLMYDLNPNLSIGTWIWGRASIYDRDVEEFDETYSFFFSPQVNYNFNDNFGMTLFYQFGGDAVMTYQDIYLEENETMNLLFSYTINQYITLQPMITVYQAQGFDVAQGNFNMWISGRFF